MVEREPLISEEQLHAYVDGQTAGDECATIETWLESHPDDAARVAAWRAQPTAIRARYGAIAPEPVPRRLDLAKLARHDRRWSRLAAAAALLAFIVGGAAGWVGHVVRGGGGALAQRDRRGGRRAQGLRRRGAPPGRSAWLGVHASLAVALAARRLWAEATRPCAVRP